MGRPSSFGKRIVAGDISLMTQSVLDDVRTVLTSCSPVMSHIITLTTMSIKYCYEPLWRQCKASYRTFYQFHHTQCEGKAEYIDYSSCWRCIRNKVCRPIATAPSLRVKLKTSMAPHDDNTWQPTQCCYYALDPDTGAKNTGKGKRPCLKRSGTRRYA